MSVQLRCNCGWESQVSEFYLGDRVTCPECGCKHAVSANAGVPYAYPPYQTWAKQTKPPLRMPKRRAVSKYLITTSHDPYASTAVMLSIVSLLMTLTMCGVLPGVLLAFFALHSCCQSKQWNAANGFPTNSRARAASALSLLSLFFGALLGLAMVCSGAAHEASPQPAQQTDVHRERPVTPKVKRQRYPDGIPSLPPFTTEPESGMRYRTVPEPQPVTPRNDFEREQFEYSEKVRQQRK